MINITLQQLENLFFKSRIFLNQFSTKWKNIQIMHKRFKLSDQSHRYIVINNGVTLDKSIYPNLMLGKVGQAALLSAKQRSPIFHNDIQDFFLQCNSLPGLLNSVRWCTVAGAEKLACVALIVVEGVDVSSLLSTNYCQSGYAYCGSRTAAPFQKLTPLCKTIVEFLHDPYTSNFADQLYSCCTTVDAKDFISANSRSAHYNFRPNGELREDLQQILHLKDNFDRRKLLVNPRDYHSAGLIIPSHKMQGVHFSRPRYAEATPKSPMFAVDCEMVATVQTNMKYGSEVVKISIVDENLKLIYSTLVKPTNVIKYYNTRVHGITKEDIDSVTTRLKDVQMDISKILPPDAIIVGHSLGCDMRALKLFHPYCIDTSRIYNISGNRTRSVSLVNASKIFLNTKIHKSSGVHDPTEDASLSMLLAKWKLSNNIRFGDLVNGWDGNLAQDSEQRRTTVTRNIFELLSKSTTCPSVVYSSAVDTEIYKIIKQYTNVLQVSNTSLALSKARQILCTSGKVVAHVKVDGHDAKKVDEEIYKLFQSLPKLSLLTVVVPSSNQDVDLLSGCAFIAQK